MDQSAEVAQYFDLISVGYQARYAPEKPFHNFFFRQRLRAATAGTDFAGKSVLDIGAGTGALYDTLIKLFPTVDYFACDISRQMLAQSAIPTERAFVGRTPELSFPRKQFDFIFLLGVTTYQSAEELHETWQFVGDHLAKDGAAIVSFTNRISLDNLLRGVLRLARPIIKRGVIAQAFATHAYSMAEVEKMVGSVGLRVTKTAHLNQAFSPFNTLLSKPSVTVAEFIERHAPEPILSFLSADFLVTAAK